MHDRYGEWPLAVGFAEVENRMVLRQLTEQTPLAKLGYGVVHRDSPDSRGIDVGFIYREEYMTVLEVEARAVLTGRERPTRDILQVTAGLYLPGGQPDTVHFSSITGLRSSAARSTPALSVRPPPIPYGGWWRLSGTPLPESCRR